MQTQLRLSGTVEESIVDGPGIRFVVFAQGCRHNCIGCHNPQTHDLNGGYTTTVDELIKSMKENPLLDGITLSGGDPFEQAEAFGELAERAAQAGYHVMTYTGYTFETLEEQRQLKMGWDRLLTYTHVLVDGPFIQSQHNAMLRFRGSENQRIIDLSQTQSNRSLVLMHSV